MVRHMNAHRAVYGEDYILPKHHWMFDIFEQLQDLPCVIDAFVIERLHLRVKRQAEPVKNLRKFEMSALSGVLNATFLEASKLRGDGLCPVCIHNGMRVSDWCSVGNLRLGDGDALFRGDELGIAATCVEDDGVLFVVMYECDFRSRVSKHGTRWRFRQDVVTAWLASDVEQVCGGGRVGRRAGWSAPPRAPRPRARASGPAGRPARPAGPSRGAGGGDSALGLVRAARAGRSGAGPAGR